MDLGNIASAAVGGMKGYAEGIGLQQAQQQQAISNVEATQKMQDVAKYNKPVELKKYVSGLPEEHREYVSNDLKDLAIEGGDPNNPIARAGDIEKKLTDFKKLTSAYTMNDSAKKFLLPKIQQTQKELEPLMKEATEYTKGVEQEKAQINANKDLLPNQKQEALAKVDARVAKYKELRKDDLEKLQKLGQQYQTDTNKYNNYVLINDGMNKAVEKLVEMGVPKNLAVMASDQPNNPDGSLTPEQQQVQDIVRNFKIKDKGTWSDPYSMKVGEKSALVQKNDMTGEIKPVIQATPNVTIGGGFNNMPKDSKNFWYDQFINTGKFPPFAARDGKSRNDFANGVAKYAAENNMGNADVVAKQAMNKGIGFAINASKKMDAAQGIFINKIEENSKTIERIRSKYGSNYDKWANVPINKLQEFVGSGDLAALKLALKSLSNEVAKVESGALGIAEVSVAQAEYMSKVHNENLKFSELMKVVDMGKELGVNARKATKKELKSLADEMSGKKTPEDTPKDNKIPQANAKGWVLHTDAKGNKAYVNPKNPKEYEEVK